MPNYVCLRVIFFVGVRLEKTCKSSAVILFTLLLLLLLLLVLGYFVISDDDQTLEVAIDQMNE